MFGVYQRTRMPPSFVARGDLRFLGCPTAFQRSYPEIQRTTTPTGLFFSSSRSRHCAHVTKHKTSGTSLYREALAFKLKSRSAWRRPISSGRLDILADRESPPTPFPLLSLQSVQLTAGFPPEPATLTFFHQLVDVPWGKAQAG